VTARTIGLVLMNGVATEPEDAEVSVFDIGFQRGYGCFEAMRSYGGKVFRLEGHLNRLERSAEHLRIALVDRSTLTSWCETSALGGDGVLRVYVTGGTSAVELGTDNVTIVYLEPLPELPTSIRLDLLDAPWHSDGKVSELTGAKTLSYGPNLAATIEAKSKGFDDAALLGSDGGVLEGPTFSLAWVRDGILYTPGLDSQILESITREATLEVAEAIGVDVSVGQFHRDDLLGADEVFIMSTVREVMPVTEVAGVLFDAGETTMRLKEAFDALVRTEAS
jgi:branched-subunit amino acid aminotransferase/4-amino-4-deoxychorismate lyase